MPFHEVKNKRDRIVGVVMLMKGGGYHEQVVREFTSERSNRTPSRLPGRSAQGLWNRYTLDMANISIGIDIGIGIGIGIVFVGFVHALTSAQWA